MPNFRRLRLPGHTWFFTVVTHRRQPILTNPQVLAALRTAIIEARRALPFEIQGWVVLPDHLHCLWQLPETDTDYASRWARIKMATGRRCAGIVSDALRTPSMRKRNESGLWQPRYWEHAIRDEVDWQRHMDYIHYNPVRHGHVAEVRDWPYSTFHRLVAEGRYPADWGSDIQPIEGVFGE